MRHFASFMRHFASLPETDVVERLVVDAEGLVGVLHQLVDRQGGVVGLHHGVRNLIKEI